MDFWHGIRQIVFALNQLANVILGNPFSLQTWADETICSRTGRNLSKAPYKYYRVVLDAMFYPWQGPNHCANAYEKEKARYQSPPEMRGDE